MFSGQSKNFGILRIVLIAACLVIIVAGIKSIASTLNIILFSILIAQCMLPFTVWLQKRGISDGISVAITVLVVVITGLSVIAVVGNAVRGIRTKIPEYTEQISGLTEGLKSRLSAMGYNSDTVLHGSTDPEQIKAIVLQLIGVLAAGLANGIFILILVVVLLIEFGAIRKKVEKRAYPEGSFMYQITALNQTSSKFVGITALIGVLQGAISTVILLLLDVDFAVTWGMLFFFLNFIPAVGFLMAVIPPTLLALFEKGSTTAIIVFISWYVINIVFDNVVRPRLLKKGFNISFFAVIILLLFWTFVLGPPGAILALPISLSLKLLFDAYMGRKTDSQPMTP